jgi:uncharacterized DUF497 family protein
MRLNFDEPKSRSVKLKHGVSLKEAQEIFDQGGRSEERRSGTVQAIGSCGGRLCSVIFEIRHDVEGD